MLLLARRASNAPGFDVPPLSPPGALSKRCGMSDEFHFNGEDDAKAEIRAAVRYLLKSAVGSDRGDIVREIIAIVNEVTRGLPPDRQDPLDDGMPGG